MNKNFYNVYEHDTTDDIYAELADVNKIVEEYNKIEEYLNKTINLVDVAEKDAAVPTDLVNILILKVYAIKALKSVEEQYLHYYDER